MISVLIKPSSSKCQLTCSYCFYHALAKDRKISDFGFMTKETMEQLIQQVFQSSRHHINFAFQGGEPTLIGLEFYKHFIHTVQQQLSLHKRTITYSLQTNGLRLTEEWCQFFKKNNFLLGVSLDGTKEIHDFHRYDCSKKGSFDQILLGIENLNKYQVDYNILSVVTNESAQRIQEIYRFFVDQHFQYLQFIPCMGDSSTNITSELTVENYQKFLFDLFDLWYEDIKKGHTISIRQFDNWFHIMLGSRPESCAMMGHCSIQNVIEADGSVYPCDFYMNEQDALGNIYDSNFIELRNTDKVKKFIQDSLSISEECRHCSWFKLCRGGCKKNRTSTSTGMQDKYCSVYKAFFTANITKMEEILHFILNKNKTNQS